MESNPCRNRHSKRKLLLQRLRRSFRTPLVSIGEVFLRVVGPAVLNIQCFSAHLLSTCMRCVVAQSERFLAMVKSLRCLHPRLTTREATRAAGVFGAGGRLEFKACQLPLPVRATARPTSYRATEPRSVEDRTANESSGEQRPAARQ